MRAAFIAAAALSLSGCKSGPPPQAACIDDKGTEYTATYSLCKWTIVDENGYTLSRVPEGFKCKRTNDTYVQGCISF